MMTDHGKATDGMLDTISELYERRDSAINDIFRMILEHPEIEDGLNAVIERLDPK